MLGKMEGRRRRWVTEDEMVGWYHRLSGHEFEQTRGHSEGQGILECCNPWGHKELDTTGQLHSLNAGRGVAYVHACTHVCTHTHISCKSSEFTSSCLGAYRADFSCASLSYTSSWYCIPEVFISTLFLTSWGHWASVLLTAVGPVVVLGEASWSSQSDDSPCVCSVADVNVSPAWKAGSQTAAEMGRFSLHVRKFSALPESPLDSQGWWWSFCVTGESKLKSARWLLSALFHFFPPPLGMCDWLMRAKLVSRGVTWIDAIHTTQSFIEKSETSA